MTDAQPCCFATKMAENVRKMIVPSFRHPLPIELETSWSTFMALPNREVVSRFGKRAGTTNSLENVREVRRLQQRSSYSTLLQHLEQMHKTKVYFIWKHSALSQQAVLLSLLYHSRTSTVNGWIRIVVRYLLPFAVVLNQQFPQHIRYGSILLITFRNDLELSDCVKNMYRLFYLIDLCLPLRSRIRPKHTT